MVQVGHQPIHPRGISNIHHVAVKFRAHRRELLGKLLQGLLADVHGNNSGAGFGQGQAGRATDATGTSNDHSATSKVNPIGYHEKKRCFAKPGIMNGAPASLQPRANPLSSVL